MSFSKEGEKTSMSLVSFYFPSVNEGNTVILNKLKESRGQLVSFLKKLKEFQCPLVSFLREA